MEPPPASGFPIPRSAFRGALLLAFLHGAVQFFLIRGAVCGADDGKRYLAYALRLEREPWRTVVRDSVDHPGYPFFVRAVFAAGGAALESPRSRLVAAQAASSVAGLLFVLAAFALSRRLFGPEAALLGMAAFVLLPRPARIFADVLSDSLHALFWTLSVLLFVRALGGAAGPGERRPAPAGTLPLAFLAGLSAAAAFWVRVDALTAAAAAGCAVLLLLFRRPEEGGPGRAAFLRSGLCFLAGFAAGVVPFVLAVGRLSPKPVLRVLVAPTALEGSPAGPFPLLAALGAAAAAAALFLAGRALRRPFVFFLGGALLGAAFSLSAARPDLWENLLASLAHFAGDLAQSLQFVHVFTGGVGIWLLLRRPLCPGPAPLFLGCALLLHSGAVLAVHLRSGYLSGRHLLPVLPLVAVFGIRAMMEAGRALGSEGRGRVLALLAILSSLAASVPSLGRRPLHEKAAGALEAGRFVAARLRPGETLHDPYFYPSFLAGISDRTRPEAEPPEGGPARYLIAEEADFRKSPELLRLREEKRLEKEADFPRHALDPRRPVGVYRVKP